MDDLTLYHNAPERAILQDGGIVVGEEVDANNQLYYIVRRGETLTCEKASGSGNPVVSRKLPDGKQTITIDTSQKTE